MKKNAETFHERCLRLREEAEDGGDDASALFYTSMMQATALRLPETIIEAGLILLLNRKLAPVD